MIPPPLSLSRGVCFDRDVARLLMLSPRPSLPHKPKPQPGRGEERRVSGLGLGLGPLRSGVRAIDRHFSQTTVQRTLPLKNRRRASERASAAPWPACRPAATSLGWGERTERLRRSAVAAKRQHQHEHDAIRTLGGGEGGQYD